MKEKAIDAIKESKAFKWAFLLFFPLFVRPMHFSDTRCSWFSNKKWLWSTPFIAIVVFNFLCKKMFFDMLLKMASHAPSPERATAFIASMMWPSTVVRYVVDGGLVSLIFILAAVSFYKHRLFRMLFLKLGFDVEAINFKYFIVRYSSTSFVFSIICYGIYVIVLRGDDQYISWLNNDIAIVALLILTGLHFIANRNSSMGKKAVYRRCLFWVSLLDLALWIGILRSMPLLISLIA